MPKPNAVKRSRTPPDYSRVVHARISEGADDELERRANLAGIPKGILVRQILYRAIGFYEAPHNRSAARRRRPQEK